MAATSLPDRRLLVQGRGSATDLVGLGPLWSAAAFGPNTEIVACKRIQGFALRLENGWAFGPN